ncbi:helix-turn-helix domain-containing protein [Oculatella sp. LEGE 06141]|uniref:helix-turn-helix domain-containing protein n=1 Tax=Oculatella sp. LEGE 06141 TaxID=1828648 RepID=UPI001881BE89|nr:helix-turn-helix domain-containing protein [Oculatella sp. LEGE 06141]MBE9181635.1 helix-turn-helix domain-containing protein [Oculatella sp. LEGE 06141]
MLEYYCDRLPAESLALEQGVFLSPTQRQFLLNKLQSNLRPEHRRRIEIMLLADMGQSQTQICEALQCSHDTARYWISMVQAGRIHAWDDLPIGRPKTINEPYLDRLKELANRSPRDYGYSFRQWTGQWLSKHLHREFDIKVSPRHINRLLRQMGLSTRQQQPDANRNGQHPASEDAGLTAGIVFCNLPSASSQSPPESLKLWPFSPKSY